MTSAITDDQDLRVIVDLTTMSIVSFFNMKYNKPYIINLLRNYKPIFPENVYRRNAYDRTNVRLKSLIGHQIVNFLTITSKKNCVQLNCNHTQFDITAFYYSSSSHNPSFQNHSF